MRKIISMSKYNENIEITGNGKDIPLLSYYELTDKEKQEYDDLIDNIEDHKFFKFKGEIYLLEEVISTIGNLPKWIQKYDGYISESYFSGLLINFTDDYDHVKVYQYKTVLKENKNEI